MNKEPRLRFTDEERADPALEKPIRKAEKAAVRADKAQANIPKKKVRQTDPALWPGVAMTRNARSVSTPSSSKTTVAS